MKIRRIVGKSMEPTYLEGQIVVFAGASDFKVDDIVIALVQDREVVKRISDITTQGVFLVGDNPKNSTDSRQYGYVALHQVKGKAILTVPFTAKRR